MTRDKGFRFVAHILNVCPVSQIPLRLLAQGSRDIPKPGPDQKTQMEIAQGSDPPAHCIDRHAHRSREVAVHELPRRPVGQSQDQRLHLVNLLDLCQVADLFPHELLEAERLPTPD